LLACGDDFALDLSGNKAGVSKFSRRTQLSLNQHVDMSDSSRDGIRTESLKRAGSLRKTSSFQRRARRLLQSHALATHGQVTSTQLTESARATSAWHPRATRASATGKETQNVCEYDGDWEMSSSDSDDDGLDYSTRHKTNPFLTSANRMTRKNPRNRNGKRPVPPLPLLHATAQSNDTSVLNLLPDYAKQTYKTALQKPTVMVQPVVRVLKPLVRDKKARAAPNKSAGKRATVQQRVKQNDGFDELDNAIDLFNFLL